MKAIIHTQYGPPEVLQLAEVLKPSPKANEVLVKVHATTVNRTDCGFRSAEYFISRFFSGLFRPKNQILGNEFAGEIVEVGKNIKSFQPGDKVFGYNEKTFGAHAEFMIMAEDAPIAAMPANMTYEEAAPILEGGHYALCDIRAAKVVKGQHVLVNGASGSIGSAAVQLCKYFGADVTAVCATQNIELLKSLGASTVIDFTKEDFTKLGQSFDFIFDAVGKSSFGKCKPLLKKYGIYISTELGSGAQNPFLALITPLLGGKKLLFPIPTINKKDVIFLKELVEAGQYKPVIDRTYTLDEIVEATRYVETGQKTGNVVIIVSHE
ncbi:MAG TPA: NAD(P)-dependent alcohol dehydrogenase [Prolixibacteraceae bacterium]|nr:NAD(P)-dependent alcohol dehydrogenase [Prolixibacteraceae bacterium]